MAKFVLASESPRRAELLRQIAIDFEVIPSNFNEASVPIASPSTYAKRLANAKAKSVAKQVKEGIIIGADTIISLDGKIIGKPKNKEDAIRTLKKLSAKVHEVTTGICVINKDSKKIVTKSVTTKVKFRELDEKLIDWYVGTGEPLGKAGSYAIQGKGAILIEWINGDYYAIMGLPLTTLAKILERMGHSFIKE